MQSIQAFGNLARADVSGEAIRRSDTRYPCSLRRMVLPSNASYAMKPRKPVRPLLPEFTLNDAYPDSWAGSCHVHCALLESAFLGEDAHATLGILDLIPGKAGGNGGFEHLARGLRPIRQEVAEPLAAFSCFHGPRCRQPRDGAGALHPRSSPPIRPTIPPAPRRRDPR